jgi:hypothetical protein
MDNSKLILIFILITLIGMLTGYVIYGSKRKFIIGISQVVQGFAVGFLLVGYIETSNKDKNAIEKKNKEDYIKYVSEIFDDIEQMFLNNPKELSNLWYEFYGFDNFPKPQSNNDNKNEKELKNADDDNNMTQFEYVTLNKLIQKIYVIYIAYNDVFDDINFSDKIRHYVKRSKKFQTVFALTKDMYSIDFYKKLLSTGLLDSDSVNVESVHVPKLISSYKITTPHPCQII